MYIGHHSLFIRECCEEKELHPLLKISGSLFVVVIETKLFQNAALSAVQYPIIYNYMEQEYISAL